MTMSTIICSFPLTRQKLPLTDAGNNQHSHIFLSNDEISVLNLSTAVGVISEITPLNAGF